MMFQSSQLVADTEEGGGGRLEGVFFKSYGGGERGFFSQGPQTWILTEITAPAPLGRWRIMLKPGSHHQRFWLVQSEVWALGFKKKISKFSK